MSEMILVVCPLLFWYWMRRSALLMNGTEDEIETTLENDLATARAMTCLPITQTTVGPF